MSLYELISEKKEDPYSSHISIKRQQQKKLLAEKK